MLSTISTVCLCYKQHQRPAAGGGIMLRQCRTCVRLLSNHCISNSDTNHCSLYDPSPNQASIATFDCQFSLFYNQVNQVPRGLSHPFKPAGNCFELLWGELYISPKTALAKTAVPGTSQPDDHSPWPIPALQWLMSGSSSVEKPAL